MEDSMNLFKSISLKLKVMAGVLFSIFAFLSFVLIRGKLSAKSKLQYEIDRTKRDIEAIHLEKDYERSKWELRALEKKEELLREKLKEVEGREYSGEDVSTNEIDDFFKTRGLM
jgi:hypothetical protein